MRKLLLPVLLIATALANAQVQAPPPSMVKSDPKLASLEKSYKASKAAYTKKPKDAKLRKQYVASTVTFGTATMNSSALPPKAKYPGALRLYREALKVDPKNAEALKNKKMIEDIYKSMGREIPK